MICMYDGITKVGTQIPPIAAKIIMDIAPKPFACSFVLAYVPTNIAKLIAAKAESIDMTIKPKIFEGMVKVGSPINGKMNFPNIKITDNWAKATNK